MIPVKVVNEQVQVDEAGSTILGPPRCCIESIQSG
jgi:hypothetical protein